MEYKVNFDSICGTWHSDNNIGNQDAVQFRKGDRICAIALADGAGSRRFAQQGARAVADTTACYVYERFDKLICMKETEIQDSLFSVILDKLDALAAELGERRIREFGSTLLFAVSDGERYMIGHLGDGSILGYRGDTFTVISYPENGPRAESTVLTTSFQSKRHLRVSKGKTTDLEGIILLSDGILPFLFNSGYSRISCESVQYTLLKAFERPQCDDASYIMMEWRF